MIPRVTLKHELRTETLNVMCRVDSKKNDYVLISLRARKALHGRCITSESKTFRPPHVYCTEHVSE